MVPLLLPAKAVAEDSLRFKTPATCTTEGGSTVQLEPGRYIPEDTWEDINESYKKNADAITRLEAENKYLKDNADESWVGWKTVTGAAILGLFAGRYIWGD